MPRPTQPPLWRCPARGQTFVSPNMPHSCVVLGVDEHFAGVRPGLREVFDALVAAAGERGPVTVKVTKSRIALQDRIRFAGIDRPRRDHLIANFVLTRPPAQPAADPGRLRAAVLLLPPAAARAP